MAKTILIVEDDIFIQGLEATRLKKDGFEVITASDGNDALSILSSKKQIDIILLDLMLPGIDGFAVLEKIRKEGMYKETPVIVFSNLSEEKDMNRAKELGASEFFVKSNFTLDEISDKIKEIIGA